ncbi:RNA polymerase sigma factor [Prosthecobacter vanneervenii]|uniref:RNA polymerase sigma-70 factor (ECF subfamily) n=1 Tax=Prosthecobacter vanneervenii TaxID=48466 RepID=A0A7W7YEN3_9BACT|nr:sigma-70 family RNA polymerase sigma factor [Prosthecobacter vanneervenii]MBB5034798.1 RNA polymerase sigma-70 factor (ECF subfamily) [Prosthecobacter vanneervenii]
MSQPELSEDELLQRAGRGDARAFDQLYDRLAPRLFGLLRQMLYDEKEAEEVLQEGFVQLWERAPSFDPERSKAFTWAVMLFRHKAIDRMRMLGRRNRLVDGAVLEQTTLGGSSQAADEALQDAERGEAVRQALNELPKEQRQLIECAFLKGLTHHVIAESFGMPLGTVKTNIRRGLLRLRDLLKGGA